MARKVNRRLRELSQQPVDRGVRYIPGEEDDGPILSQLGFLMVSVLVFVLVTAAASWFGSRQIQEHLSAVTATHLAEAGYTDLTVVADGRDIELVGMVPEGTDLGEIRTLVELVPGVRDVSSSLTFDILVPENFGPAAAEPLTLVWDGDSVVVTGTLSNDSVRSDVIARLESAFATGLDHEGLTTRQGTSSEDAWLGGVLDVIDRVAAAADEGRVVANGDAGVATVTAELPDRQQRLDLRSETEEILAAGPLSFVSGFTVEDAPPPPPPQVVEELQHDLDTLLEGKVVEFALNSDRLTSGGEALLDDVLEALVLVPDVPVEIAGHADAQGPDDLNLELSDRRARSVFRYLVDNGADPDRFQVIGYGETRPIADNDTEEGRARNRRIEFIALLD